MRKNSARLVLFAATAALAITPVAASASAGPKKPGFQVTRTQSGANVDKRDVQSNRAVDERYNRFNPFANFSVFIEFLAIGAGT